MSFYSLLHLNLLLESLLVEDFGLDASQCFCFLRYDFGFSCLFLSSLLLCVQSLTITLPMQLHVVILRHC